MLLYFAHDEGEPRKQDCEIYCEIKDRIAFNG